MSDESINKEFPRLSRRGRIMSGQLSSKQNRAQEIWRNEMIALAESRDKEINAGKATPFTHAELMALVRG